MFQRLLKKFRLVSVFVLSLITVSGAFTHVTHAAILSVAPSQSSVSVGNIVSLNITVNANGTAINTAGAVVHFPTDLLEVMSISKSSSVFSLWVQDPTFSNTDGTVTFTGGLPTPGFIGSNGNIISIVFRAKKQGTASVVISDGSVLANDGLGTDVLTAMGSASIVIGSSAEAPLVAPSSSLPPLPIVTSATDPDQNQWYSDISASFSWVVPDGVTSVQTLLSRESDSVPTITYDNSVSQRTVDNIQDGVFYFHIRYVNSAGNGPIATYKIQIDSTPPEKFTVPVSTQDVQDVVTLNAVDAMSGIDHYTIQIDNEPSINVQNSALVNDQYVLPTQNAGEHNLVVIAYDKAGNHTESDTTYTSGTIVAPVILAISPTNSPAVNCDTASVACSAEVTRSDVITVKGETKYPNTPISIFIQPDGEDAKTYTTTTAGDGSYIFITPPLTTTGSINVWSQLMFSNEVQSPISNKVVVEVKDNLIVGTSKAVIYGMSFIIPAVAFILALLLMMYLGWHKFFGLKKRLRGEADDAVESVRKSMSLFKDELENQLHKLENMREDHDLNKKEEKIFKELKANIDSIDDFIEKKIKKIK